MGYMQVYRVGGEKAESPMRKISQLLTGDGIDCDELGEFRPDVGCVLVDFTAGEEMVQQTELTVPQLPQILVASTQLLGSKQFGIADEVVSPDLDGAEIIRRVQCMQNMAVRLLEEVPEPDHTGILVDGDTEGDEATLKNLAEILNKAEIEWAPLQDESDGTGTGIIYTHYRRLSYARLLQRDYPGYVHIQMAPTPELRIEALTTGDISYTRRTNADEITVRHERFLHMLDRLRNPDKYRHDPLDHRAMIVLFIGERNVGNDLRTGISAEEIDFNVTPSVAGALSEALKSDAVLIDLSSMEEAKERLTFLQLLLKNEDKPPAALLFPKEASAQLKAFGEKNGVTIIESYTIDSVRDTLKGLKT
ncbi:MAG: hypothetical protein O7G87_09775 [bacterium]|nr:hypothetical protein [bacterium]